MYSFQFVILFLIITFTNLNFASDSHKKDPSKPHAVVKSKINKTINLVKYPKVCDVQSGRCAFKTFLYSYVLTVNHNSVSLGPNTSIIITNNKKIEIISGHIVVTIHQPNIVISSSVTKIKPQVGTLIVSKNGKGLVVDALTANVSIEASYKNITHFLDPGYSMILNGIKSNGSYDVEVVRPVNFKKALVMWAKGYFGSKKDFYGLAIEFKDKWAIAVSDISSKYKKTAEREIASNRAFVLKKLKSKQAYLNESQRLIDILKEKNNPNY